jgi:KUP system potassium uptake protein
VTPEAVFGVLSMIFWAVTIVVSLKYMVLVLAADNDGEGRRSRLARARAAPSSGRRPAASNGDRRRADQRRDVLRRQRHYAGDLGAVGGRGLARGVAGVRSLVLPLTLVILLALFVGAAARHRARSAACSARSCWCGSRVLALLGLVQIVANPGVLRALDPLYALRFALEQPGADVHRDGGGVPRPDRRRGDVRGCRPLRPPPDPPCLVLDRDAVPDAQLLRPGRAGPAPTRRPPSNPFFLLAPPGCSCRWCCWRPAATVIASQAVISGAFSMTSQAIKLGYLPRMPIEYTSETQAGQVYVPAW